MDGVEAAVTIFIALVLLGCYAQYLSVKYADFERRMKRLAEREEFYDSVGGKNPLDV